MIRIENNLETGQITETLMTEAEIAELQTNEAARIAAIPYTHKRAAEYPDFRDYLDGLVKGDQAQIDAYFAACQAVKNKYPKV
jgi:hypothetical protein